MKRKQNIFYEKQIDVPVIKQCILYCYNVIMEESAESKYALQVALKTLKERCQNLQQRLSLLQEENIVLRVQCCKNESKNSVTELDALKIKVLELTEQKNKLENNFALVADENKHLWFRLSKLIQLNKSLGLHLTKINESLNNNKKTLILSNTHSDCDAKKAVAENDKISLELEDVSLKLISTIAKEKTELEAQCSEMLEIQSTVSDLFGASYLNENNDTLVEELQEHLTELRNIKDTLIQQNGTLETTLVTIDNVKYDICSKCGKLLDDREEELQLESLAQWGTPKNSNTFLQDDKTIYICPMCSEIFKKLNLNDFLLHVENHFKT